MKEQININITGKTIVVLTVLTFYFTIIIKVTIKLMDLIRW